MDYKLTPVQFLIICPLVFLAGFVDAIAGGGGLISLPAFLLAGVPIHTAIGSNKLGSIFGTGFSTVQYWRKGYIDFKHSIGCIVTAFIGAALGAKLALLISEDVFRIIMLIILPVIGLYVTFGKGLQDEREPYPLKKTVLLSMVIALVVGAYDGFYGPGAGAFLLLLLSAVAHMSIRQANGTTKLINFCTNFAALCVYLPTGNANILLGLVAGACNVAGNTLGVRCFEKGGVKIVKLIMPTVLLIFFVKLILEMLGIA